MYLIIYQKYNGSLIYRIRYTSIDKKVGEFKINGWQIIDIQKYKDGRFYSMNGDNDFYIRNELKYKNRSKIKKILRIMERILK